MQRFLLKSQKMMNYILFVGIFNQSCFLRINIIISEIHFLENSSQVFHACLLIFTKLSTIFSYYETSDVFILHFQNHKQKIHE